MDLQTPEYRAWVCMKSRCKYVNNLMYSSWAGRGITVCDRWANSFENFFEDMGEKPSPKHSLDRINNDGNYEPSNCRWATSKEQAANKRYNPKTKLSQNGIIIMFRELSYLLTAKRADGSPLLNQEEINSIREVEIIIKNNSN